MEPVKRKEFLSEKDEEDRSKLRKTEPGRWSIVRPVILPKTEDQKRDLEVLALYHETERKRDPEYPQKILAVTRQIQDFLDNLVFDPTEFHYYLDALDTLTPYLKREVPLDQLEFMEQHHLFFPGWIPWLRDGVEHTASLSQAQTQALEAYTSNSYQVVWDYYNQGRPAKARRLCRDFDSIWSEDGRAMELPVGAVLFEGQGNYEDDLVRWWWHTGSPPTWDPDIDPTSSRLAQRRYESYLDRLEAWNRGDHHRHTQRLRPSSTSWNLNVALNFTGYQEGGLVVVHRIVAPGVRALNLQRTSRQWSECEVLVQPGLALTITSCIETRLTRVDHGPRIAIADSERSKLYRIMFVDVRPL